MYENVISVFLILYIFYDLNYVFRTLLTIIIGRLFEKRHGLEDSTKIYGICTFLDCDVRFKSLRLARLLREIDVARFHYYDRTGIFDRSHRLNISYLQGSTFTLTSEPVGLFQPYKIITKLIYWEDRSLYLEHKVVTLSDEKVRNVIISRQYSIGKDGIVSPEIVLKELLVAMKKPRCPEYIQSWLQSMNVSSKNLRNN